LGLVINGILDEKAARFTIRTEQLDVVTVDRCAGLPGSICKLARCDARLIEWWDRPRRIEPRDYEQYEDQDDDRAATRFNENPRNPPVHYRLLNTGRLGFCGACSFGRSPSHQSTNTGSARILGLFASVNG
jgi:hypothetical protein